MKHIISDSRISKEVLCISGDGFVVPGRSYIIRGVHECECCTRFDVGLNYGNDEGSTCPKCQDKIPCRGNVWHESKCFREKNSLQSLLLDMEKDQQEQEVLEEVYA